MASLLEAPLQQAKARNSSCHEWIEIASGILVKYSKSLGLLPNGTRAPKFCRHYPNVESHPLLCRVTRRRVRPAEAAQGSTATRNLL